MDRRSGGGQYLQTTPAHLVEIAARLVAAQGLLRIEGEWAEATRALMDQAERFENARRAGGGRVGEEARVREGVAKTGCNYLVRVLDDA